MHKPLRAAHGRARASRSCSRSRLGIIASSFAVIGLTACGGGDGTTPAHEPAQSQRVPNEQAHAQAVAAASPASGLIAGAGWVAQPPTMASKATYTPSYTGTAYYFDPSISSDTGHDGKSPERAWKYLWRAGQKRDWQSGDAILLKCGSVWRDQALSLNGGVDPTVKNGLLVAAYGCEQNPARPVISGASPLPVAVNASWSAIAGQPGVHGIALTGPIKRLYRDGQPQTPARYPNEQAGKRFAITVELPKLSPSETDDQFKARKDRFFKVTDADRQAIGSQDIVGATVYVRTNPYTIEAARVQSFNTGTGVVELASALKFPIETTAGYILEGKPWMVDQAGEWAMDGNSLRYASATPSTAALAAVVPRKSSQGADLLTYGLWFAQVDNMRIEYLRFEYNDISVDLDQSPNVTIRDIESVHAYDGGVLAGNSPGLQILDSRLDHSGLNGIRIFRSDNAKVIGNVVSNTGMSRVANPEGAGVKPNLSLQGWAIRVQGEGSLVDNNLVQDSANVGIAFSDEMGTVVRNNTVLRPCLLLTDCGGIYTSNDAALGDNDQLDIPAPSTITSRVHGNLVAGLRSNLDGSFIWGALRDHIAGENQANGIYLDAGTTTVEVYNNIISGAEVGIFLHNSAYNVIRNNVTQGISYASFFVGSDSTKNPWITRGNQVLNNTFFSRRTVDGAAFGKVPYKGVRGELTHAQLWLHTTQNARTFFQDGASGTGSRNISSGNKTLTLSRAASPSVWRLEAADRRDGVPLSLRMEQVSGAAWGLKSFYDPIEQLGHAQWLALTGGSGNAPDTETSPVSYRTHKFSTTSASILANGEFKPTLFGTWTTYAGQREYLASGCPTFTTRCAQFHATGADDRMTSVPFNLAGGMLHQVSYTVASSSTQGVRHSAHIGTRNAPSTVMDPLSTLMELKAGEARRIETFVRSGAGAAEATMSLRASDGTAAWLNKKAYWADAAVKPVSDTVSVLPQLDTLGVSAVNASNEERTFTCADLGMSDCANLVHAHNNLPVAFPVKVPARQALRFYVRLGSEWMDE